MSDQHSAATTQGGETRMTDREREAFGDELPDDRHSMMEDDDEGSALHPAAIPLANTIRAAFGVAPPAAAPVEEGREGEAERVWGDPAKLAAYEGHNAKCGQCANSYGADEMCQEGLELHHAWWLTLAATRSPAASRAPHEGPTSGLREDIEEIRSLANRVLCAAYNGDDSKEATEEFHRLWDWARESTPLAASPLAPTSDGALREDAEVSSIRQQITAIPADVEDERIVAVYAPAGIWRDFAASRPVVENTGETT